MASQADDHSQGPLDANAGREVVYCHACFHEWYRDDHGLECPRCGDDITEIIEAGNDPREMNNGSSESTSPEPGHHHHHFVDDDDSDPDEADITEHLGSNGYAFRRSVRDGPDHTHHNPAVDPVLQRFLDMIQGFGPPRRAEGGGLFPQGPPEQEHYGAFQPPRIHRTTFASGFGGGTTSVTIVSGPLHSSRSAGAPGVPGPDPFQAILSNIVRDIGPPQDENHAGADGTGGGPPPGFARSLHDILSLFNPANAMAGDAVYSQEALDRIITSLMEANPQSNAAPPATEEGLRNLDRKPVDKEMLGPDGKTECTICIDEMKEGETVIYLPCKHWFHEDCVVLWLKEHNTCPICRTPIEKSEGNTRNQNNDGNSNSNSGEGSSGSHGFPPPPHTRYAPSTPWFSRPTPGFEGSSENYDGGAHNHPMRPSRPPPQTSNLNEIFRSLQQRGDRDYRDRDSTRDTRDRGMTSGFRYDTSRLQRRSSHSPTSPRATGPEEQGARMRQRSPSQSRWSMAERDRDQRRSSGHGPFSWLRDRFGGGGSGSGPTRDERRQ